MSNLYEIYYLTLTLNDERQNGRITYVPIVFKNLSHSYQNAFCTSNYDFEITSQKKTVQFINYEHI